MRYRGRSAVAGDAIELVASSEAPRFDGQATHPAVTADAIALVARVAVTRFPTPRAGVSADGRAADPVVTAEPGRLRFEAFSRCCGAHVRYDLLSDGMSVRDATAGTASVELGERTVRALGEVSSRQPGRLSIVAASGSGGAVDRPTVTRRVPLPKRWVHGFGEVPAAVGPDAPELVHLDAVAAQRFLRALPGGRAGRASCWAVPSAAGLRLASRHVAGAPCVGGPTRLAVLTAIAPWGGDLRVYGDRDDPEPCATTWVLAVPGGRVSLSLSPEWSRGFTGEGGLLRDLAASTADDDARAITRQLGDRSRFTLRDVVTATRRPASRACAGIASLSLHGELGYDISERVYFWRRLPYPRELRADDPARLRGARALVDRGAVAVHGDGSAVVMSDGNEYRVTLSAAGPSCTCPWTARHGGSRGPCRHILAVLLSRPAA